jgi:hypothetical protein
MLQKLTMFVVTWDSPELPIPEAITWEELHEVVQAGADLQWDMLGERRTIPLYIVDDVLRVHEGNSALIRLGRSSEVKKDRPLHRDQTLSYR